MSSKSITIAIHSDLHHEHIPCFTDEFNLDEIKEYHIPKYDIEPNYICLSGDIGNLGTIGTFMKCLTESYPNSIILYVLGNHEYYGLYFQDVVNKYKEVLKPFKNVYLLENDVFVDEKNKVMFFGATLWTDFNYGNKQDFAINLFRGTTEFILIKSKESNTKLLNPIEMINVFNETVGKIKEIASQDRFQDYKKIMISHFLPHENLIASQYKHNREPERNSYWISHIPDVVNLFDVWIYGHSHNNIEIDVEFNGKKTKILSNQRGYPNKIVANVYENSCKTIAKLGQNYYYDDYLFHFDIE